MSTQRHITRRQMIGAALAGASGVFVGTILQGGEQGAGLNAGVANADPKIRGPFPILTTPFTASGAVDFDVLANQARFVDWGGCPGMIWPQSGDSIDLLTTDEKLQGMEVLSKRPAVSTRRCASACKVRTRPRCSSLRSMPRGWRRRRSSRGRRTRAGPKMTCVT